MDNFGGNPRVPVAMMETAENVAKEIGITKEDCDALVLRRYEQYQTALANNRAFQKRYMFPAEVMVNKKQTKLVEQDEGWTPTTAEGLAKLKPVRPGGESTASAPRRSPRTETAALSLPRGTGPKN
jgi:acetyl-CoA acetyltransferase